MGPSEPTSNEMKVFNFNWLHGELGLHEEVVQSTPIQEKFFEVTTEDGVIQVDGELQEELFLTPVDVSNIVKEEDIEFMDDITTATTNNSGEVLDVNVDPSNLNFIATSIACVENSNPHSLEIPAFILEDQVQVISEQNVEVEETGKKAKVKRGQEMQCHLCDAVFNGRSQLLKHQKTTHPNSNSGTVKCKEQGCSFACFRVNQLVDHLSSIHQLKIFEEELEFSDETEFLSWKEDYEMQANCQYRLTSTKMQGKCRYYNCSRSGYYIRKEEKDLTRRSKLKGTSKLNGHCVAGLIVKHMEDGKCQVMHTKTHYGHVLETNHLRLSASQRNFIKVLVESGTSVEDIVDKVNTMTTSSASFRVSRKDVMNVISSFQSKKLGTSFSFSSPYSAWNVSNFALQLKGNIIFHKASGECSHETSNLKLDDFMLCFMTQYQVERISQMRFSGLGVSLAMNSKSENSLVIICVYACVLYIGRKAVDLPLAWCVSNAVNEEILRVFFGSIKRKCGDLNMKYMVSEEGLNAHGPWCDTFRSTSAPMNVTAPWSVQQCISFALEKYVKSEVLRTNLHKSIRVLFSVRKVDEFRTKLRKFVKDAHNCPAYQKFMMEYFIPEFVEGRVPNFAAALYSKHSLEITCYEEATIVLRQKMLQASCKPVSRAVSDILKYVESKQRIHDKMPCFGSKTGSAHVEGNSNPVNKSMVKNVECMLNNLIGLLDEDHLPSDFEEATRRLDVCGNLIAESFGPSEGKRPLEEKNQSSEETPKVNALMPSNCLRLKKRGFSGRLKLQTPYDRSATSTGRRIANAKTTFRSSTAVSSENWEQINDEKFVLLEEAVDSN